jgi:hypothetical protein
MILPYNSGPSLTRQTMSRSDLTAVSTGHLQHASGHAARRTPMAAKPACDAGCHVTLGRPPSGCILRLSRRQRGRQVPIDVLTTCPSGVLRHLVSRKHVRDTSVRRRVAGRHYPLHRGRCDTLQHRLFHPGSVGVRGSSPLSSTRQMRFQGPDFRAVDDNRDDNGDFRRIRSVGSAGSSSPLICQRHIPSYAFWRGALRLRKNLRGDNRRPQYYRGCNRQQIQARDPSLVLRQSRNQCLSPPTVNAFRIVRSPKRSSPPDLAIEGERVRRTLSTHLGCSGESSARASLGTDGVEDVIDDRPGGGVRERHDRDDDGACRAGARGR